MPSKSKVSGIQKSLAQAEAALQSGQWFEAERLGLSCVDAAIAADDHGLAADACLPLQEARRQRLIAAIDACEGQVTIVTSVPQEVETATAGVHLLIPHAVGADARRLRIAALQSEVPALVVCREPDTERGLVPIVAIGGRTVRAYVDPPDDPESPDLAWVLGAQEALGDAAIDNLDPALTGPGLVDSLRTGMESIPDHERIHQALASALRELAG